MPAAFDKHKFTWLRMSATKKRCTQPKPMPMQSQRPCELKAGHASTPQTANSHQACILMLEAMVFSGTKAGYLQCDVLATTRSAEDA